MKKLDMAFKDKVLFKRPNWNSSVIWTWRPWNQSKRVTQPILPHVSCQSSVCAARSRMQEPGCEHAWATARRHSAFHIGHFFGDHVIKKKKHLWENHDWNHEGGSGAWGADENWPRGKPACSHVIGHLPRPRQCRPILSCCYGDMISECLMKIVIE